MNSKKTPQILDVVEVELSTGIVYGILLEDNIQRGSHACYRVLVHAREDGKDELVGTEIFPLKNGTFDYDYVTPLIGFRNG